MTFKNQKCIIRLQLLSQIMHYKKTWQVNEITLHTISDQDLIGLRSSTWDAYHRSTEVPVAAIPDDLDAYMLDKLSAQRNICTSNVETAAPEVMKFSMKWFFFFSSPFHKGGKFWTLKKDGTVKNATLSKRNHSLCRSINVPMLYCTRWKSAQLTLRKNKPHKAMRGKKVAWILTHLSE